MEIELPIDKDEEIEIEDIPAPLAKAQIAAVEAAIRKAVDNLNIREIINDSVRNTLFEMRRKVRP